MILTVTLNFALDITYQVERLERGATTRIETFARRAGGKGVNVARVLHALGRDVAVTGLAGGFIGRSARSELRAAGLRDELTEIEGESRLTLVVVDREGEATGFSEPGPVVTGREWLAFCDRFRQLLPAAEAVVISGSIPGGVGSDAYAQLVRAALEADVLVLLDADGEPCQRALSARPAMVKINRSELGHIVGDRDMVDGAAALRRAGAGTVVVTAGASGLTAVTEDSVLHAVPPEPLSGNPTGAGDAASAALVVGMIDGLPWPARLVDAAALSAAAVCAPLAGSFDEELYRRLRSQIVVAEPAPDR